MLRASKVLFVSILLVCSPSSADETGSCVFGCGEREAIPPINLPDLSHLPCNSTTGLCPGPYDLVVVPTWELWTGAGPYDDSGWWKDSGTVDDQFDFISSSAFLGVSLDLAAETTTGIRVGNTAAVQALFCRNTVSPWEVVTDDSGESTINLPDGLTSDPNFQQKRPSVVIQQQDASHDSEWFPRLWMAGRYDACDGVSAGDISNSSALTFPVSNTDGDQWSWFAPDGTHPEEAGGAWIGAKLLFADWEGIFPASQENLIINGASDSGVCTDTWEVTGGTSTVTSSAFDPRKDKNTDNQSLIGAGCSFESISAAGVVLISKTASTVREGEYYVFEIWPQQEDFQTFTIDLIDQTGAAVAGTQYFINSGGFWEEDADGLFASRMVYGYTKLRMTVRVPAAATAITTLRASVTWSGTSSINIDQAFGKLKAHQRDGFNYILPSSASPLGVAWVTDSMGAGFSFRVPGATSRLQGATCGTAGVSETPPRTTPVRTGLSFTFPCLADNMLSISGLKFIDKTSWLLFWDSYFQWAANQGNEYIVFQGFLNDTVSGDNEATPFSMYQALIGETDSLQTLANKHRIKPIWIPMWPERGDTTALFSKLTAGAGNSANTATVMNKLIESLITRTAPAE